VCSTGYSFSRWWHGEASHKLGVQSADVSALPDVLPVKCVSSFLSKSLDHRVQKVYGCVLVATLGLRRNNFDCLCPSDTLFVD
jgi:hypothetical protein